MRKNIAVALEIGSSKLKVAVAREGINNTLNIIDTDEVLYDGYYEGAFVDFEKLKSSLIKLFDEIDYKKKRYNKKLYVGLPAEFVGVEVVKADVNFDGYKKIRKQDIEGLFAEAASKLEGEGIEIISTSAITYYTDDGGRILYDPLGKKAKQLSADVSVVIAEKDTIVKLNQIFEDLEFTEVEYVCETLTQAISIISKEEREHECLLIDVGHLSTSISFIKGDGLLSLVAYSLGGGHITGDLCETFNISYQEAEKLKSQMVISVKAGRQACYDLVTPRGVERINLMDANNVAIDRVAEIGRAINSCVINHSPEFISFLPTYLTGLGLTKLKGAKDYLSKCIARNIIIAMPDKPGQDKPENTAIFSILDYALKNSKK